MKAFDIQGDQVTFTPEFLAIPQIKTIWDGDKKKGKVTAIQALSYIVFLCDNSPKNPYAGYSSDIRHDVLVEDFIREKGWKPNDKIVAAIEKLKKLMETTSSRLLESSKVAADKLAVYFENIDFTILDDNGKPIYSARELASNLSAVGNIVKSLRVLEDQVKKEHLDDNTARGGAEIGIFELPSDD
jgi:hypothetical protein